MKHLARISCLAILALGFVLTSVAADKTLKELQKLTKEGNIGANGNIIFADVNGDGYKDLIARYTKSGPPTKPVGGVWLWRGTKFSDSVDCTIDLTFNSGVNVAAGDLNGDGKADLAFLSNYSSYHPPKIVWGRTTWPKNITTADLQCGPVVDGQFEAQGQYASMAIGDFNDDGYGDIVYQIQGNDTAGPYLNLYGSMLAMYFGGAAMDSVADWVFKGGPAYTITGTTNTITPRYFSPWHMDVGDFNGDGITDLLSSGWNAYSSITIFNYKGVMQGMYNCGSGLIFLGGSGFSTSPRPDVILMASDQWLRYTTPVQYLWLGYSVYNAGDLNKDGIDDISLPGWYIDIGLVFAGNSAWVKAATDNDVLVVRDEMLSWTKGRFDFAGYADQLGMDLLSVGDVNGDGYADLAATRNYFGGMPEDRGIRLFFTKPGKTGAVKPDYETSDYVLVEPGSFDFDNDGISEFLAQDLNNHLTVLKVNPVYIADVADVPFDQGGNVRVHFSSTVDNDASKVPYFSLWRALPTDGNAPVITPNIAQVTKEFKGKASFTTAAYRWEWVKNVPAQLQGNYSATVPTLYDSTALTAGKHFFMVIAHTDDPNKFYMSAIDSGQSVDNLAPAAPAPIAGQVISSHASLSWNANTEADLKQYVIYKATSPNIPDGAPIYATTTEKTFLDPVALGADAVYYVVKAEDVHGNLSAKSNELKISLTGVEVTDTRIPTEYKLDQNYPNPFNPATTISYSLKQAGVVSLKVMNVLGEVVATLESGYKPAGKYDVKFDASRLASGVYIYQIRTGEFVDAKRMLLVK